MKAFKILSLIGLGLALAPATAEARLSDADVTAAYEQSLAARGAGRPDVAEAILRELIEARPNSAQLRFDLGVALAEQGRCAAASRAFETGREMTGTPNFDRVTQVAMQDLCPGLAPVEFSLGFQLIHDSNANGGAGTGSIRIGGIPIALSDDARAQDAAGYQLTGQLGYNLRLGQGQYLVPTLGFGVTDYEGESFDSLTLTPGLFYRHQGDRIDWRVGPTLILGYDHDGKSAEGTGVLARAAIAIGRRSGLYLDASHIDMENTRNPLRDYRQQNISGTFVHNPTAAPVSLRAGISLTDLDYADDFQDLRSTEITLGVSGALSQTIGYDLSVSRRISEGSVPHFLFGERRDRVNTLAARISFASLEGWYGRPYVGVSHAVSSSTWDIKTFDRTQTLFGFTRSF